MSDIANSNDIERQYVFDAYKTIAHNFNYSRTIAWKSTADFLNSLASDSFVLDAGCGNGRNMLYRTDIRIMGCDACPELIEICREKKLDVFVSDIRSIAIDDNTFDAVICVAVIGHIYSEDDRIRAVNELLRVTKENGIIYVQCWHMSAIKSSKRDGKFRKLQTKNDYIVTYGIENVERYYHLYDELELFELLKKCDCIIHKIYNDSTGVVGIISKCYN